MPRQLMEHKNYITKTGIDQCDIALPKFCRSHYKFFKIIIISHNLLLTFGCICRTFYTFGD